MHGNMPTFDFDRYQLQIPAGTYQAGFTYLNYDIDERYGVDVYSVAVVAAATSVGPGSEQIEPSSAAINSSALGLLTLRIFVPGAVAKTTADPFYVDVIMIRRPSSPVSVLSPAVD